MYVYMYIHVTVCELYVCVMCVMCVICVMCVCVADVYMTHMTHMPYGSLRLERIYHLSGSILWRDFC